MCSLAILFLVLLVTVEFARASERVSWLLSRAARSVFEHSLNTETHLKSRRFPRLWKRGAEEDSLVFALSKAILADERILPRGRLHVRCLHLSLPILQTSTHCRIRSLAYVSILPRSAFVRVRFCQRYRCEMRRWSAWLAVTLCLAAKLTTWKWKWMSQLRRHKANSFADRFIDSIHEIARRTREILGECCCTQKESISLCNWMGTRPNIDYEKWYFRYRHI